VRCLLKFLLYVCIYAAEHNIPSEFPVGWIKKLLCRTEMKFGVAVKITVVVI